jgi:hypothetical protein
MGVFLYDLGQLTLSGYPRNMKGDQSSSSGSSEPASALVVARRKGGAMIARRFYFAVVSIWILLTGAAAARGQLLAVYGTFSPTQISNIATGNTTGLNSTYTTSSYWATGVGGGATLRLLHIAGVGVGLDLRGSTRPGTQGADTGMGGIKLSVKPPLAPIRVYVEAAGGYVGTRATVTTGPASGNTATDEFAAYEILGGIDYTLLPHLDLRLVEVGGGKGYPIVSVNNGIPTMSFMTINTGVVVHF